MLLFASAIILSGCISIGARVIESVFADPRTKNHEYYAEVKLTFNLDNMAVSATRYAEVHYLTGDGAGPFRRCIKADLECWVMTDHFFVGLPNGDIVDAFINTRKLDLSNVSPGATIRTRAHLTEILRDQPNSPYAKEHGRCLSLDDQALLQIYQIPSSNKADYSSLSMADANAKFEMFLESRLPMEVEFTRLSVNSRVGRIVDPSDFERSRIADGEHCTYFIRQASESRTIRSIQ